MLANYSKIKSYIGFSKKSRNIIYGTDDILKLMKKCYIVICSNSLSRNSLNKLEMGAQKESLKIYILENNEFNDIIENGNIKAVAITDKNLSDAIKIQLG